MSEPNGIILRECATNLTAAFPLYRNVWICDETWLRLIKTHYPTTINAFDCSREVVNRAFATLAGAFDWTNTTGWYRKQFKTPCPYGGNRRVVWFYYCKGEGDSSPPEPARASECRDAMSDSFQMQSNRVRVRVDDIERRKNDGAGKMLANAIEHKKGKRQSPDDPNAPGKTPSKAPRRGEANEITPARGGSHRAPASGGETGAAAGGPGEVTPRRQNDAAAEGDRPEGGGEGGEGGGAATVAAQEVPIYWESPEAAKLFGFTGEGDDVYELLKQRIATLAVAIADKEGYKHVVTHNGAHLSEHYVFTVRNKCMFLRMAYKQAIKLLGRKNDEGNNYQWVKDCCQGAVERVNEVGIHTTVNAVTLSTWNKLFRTAGKFAHPNPYIANGLKPKPPFFEMYPTAPALCQEYILSKLEIFSMEMLRCELKDVILPGLMEEAKKDGTDEESAEFKYLQSILEKPPSLSTVTRWVRHLGYKHGTTGKSYYVDGHEHPAQKKHRSELTKEYLSVIERLTHRWVQLEIEEYESMQASLKEGNKIVQRGYRYKDPESGAEKIEFHVDDHECLQEYANETLHAEFGGMLSVRKPPGEKPVIIFGQDESIYSQNSFNGKQWIAPDGQRALLPKNEGRGKMASAFVSRETGFGMEISDEQLKKINEKRAQDGEYFDKEAAKAVLNTTKKHPLKESPFVVQFEYGGSNGYWSGNHMVIETEDCIDCLDVIYEGRFNYVFLFDSSSGHAKKRAGGLDAKNMNKGWGGKLMRKTKIEEADGYLGPYHDPQNPRMVQVGQEQSMNYETESDLQHGPFDLDDVETEARRHDDEVELAEDKKGSKDKSKAELVADLMHTDYGKAEGQNALQKKLVRDLKKKAENLGIATQKTVTHRKRSGWAKKGKGLLQVLHERGHVNPEEISRYKMRVEDDDGNLVPEYSLVHLMEQCTDFQNEVSQLEHVCQELGVRALITTKYHAEYAGEGIEYCWGYSKAVYRRYPIESKKGKANFDKLVSACLSRDVLTKDLVRKFSKRARSYMVTYKMLELQGEGADLETFSHHKIETMKKIVKSHRAALDFDRGFIMSNVSVKDFDFEKEVEHPSELMRAGIKQEHKA